MRHLPHSFPLIATLAFASSPLLAGCGPECGGGSLNLSITSHTTSFTGMNVPYQPGRVTATMSADRSTLTVEARECTDQTLPTTRSMTIHVSACGEPGQPCCGGTTCGMGTACNTPSGGSTPLCLIADPMVINRLGSTCDPAMGACPQNSTCTNGFCVAAESTLVAAGQHYAISGNTTESSTYVLYSEGPQASPTAQWRGRGGWVAIDTIQGNIVTLRLDSVLFDPNPAAMGTAAGVFTFDGTGRVEGVRGL